MSKPVAYLRDRSLPVLALAMAYSRVILQGKAPAKPERKRTAKSDSRQLTLKGIEREGK